MKTFMLLTVLMTSFAYAQTFEERVNLVHPNASILFNDPVFLRHPLLALTANEAAVNNENSKTNILSRRGEEYCKFLKYGELLAITVEATEPQSMMTLKGLTLIATYQRTNFHYSRNVDHFPSKVKSLRCKI